MAPCTALGQSVAKLVQHTHAHVLNNMHSEKDPGFIGVTLFVAN